MIENALIGDFVPLVALPRSTVTRFYVFSARWDKSVRQEAISVAVEILAGKSRTWKPIGTWLFHIGSGMWHELEGGSSYSVHPDGSKVHWGNTYPEDVHKYTLDSEMYAEGHALAGPTTEITGMSDAQLAEEQPTSHPDRPQNLS